MHSPLDLPTVQALGEFSSYPSVQASANAWLAAYRLAHQLAFTEAVALRQANTAWDLAAELWHQLPWDGPVYELTESGRCAIQVRC
ncbi:MAG: hypothetical protein ACR2IK_10310 [Chloroflexota bacterium]